jgi:hypothetical protein
MAKPSYRAASVERTTPVTRHVVFEAALTTVGAADEILSMEPPWRLVTRSDDAAVDLHETTVAIVDAPRGGTLFSVSAVIGPEVTPGALDRHLGTVTVALHLVADRIESAIT